MGTKMIQYEKVIASPITGTHLTEFKGYYEVDFVNEFSKERFVFTVPKFLFDAMIFSKVKIKPKPEQRKTPLIKPVPVMTS